MSVVSDYRGELSGDEDSFDLSNVEFLPITPAPRANFSPLHAAHSDENGSMGMLGVLLFITILAVSFLVGAFAFPW